MGSGSQSAVSSKHAISTRKEFLTYKTHNEQQPEFVIVPVEKKSLEDTLKCKKKTIGTH